MSNNLIQLPAGVSRTNKKLRSRMRCYQQSKTRPVKIAPYHYNWVLLEEGCDVYWDGIEGNLIEAIDNDRLDILNVIVRSSYLRDNTLQYRNVISVEAARLLTEAGIRVSIIDNTFNSSGIPIDDIKTMIDMGVNIQLRPGTPMRSSDFGYVEELLGIGVEVLIDRFYPTYPKDVIDRLRQLDVNPKMMELEDGDYSLDECINIHDNIGDQPIPIRYKNRDNRLLQYLKLVRGKYNIVNIVDHVASSYEYLIEEYHLLDGDQRDELFELACDENQSATIRYMISQGYQVEIESVRWGCRDIPGIGVLSELTIILLLEILPINDGIKYELWKKRLIPNYYYGYLYFLHPVTYPFWCKLRQSIEYSNSEIVPNSDYIRSIEEYYADDLGSIRRLGYYVGSAECTSAEYTLLTVLGNQLDSGKKLELFRELVHNDDRLRYITDPQFQDMWSLIPNSNIQFSWFLYNNRLPLPPLDNYEGWIIPHLLNESDQLDIVRRISADHIVLLKFLYYSGVNISSLRGYSCILDEIMDRQPVIHMKSAMKI